MVDFNFRRAARLVGVLGLVFVMPSREAAAEPLDGVVLVIADGTSSELITAARIYSQGVRGRLALEDFPHSAVVRTYSASDLVTDSAAAATAMARGVKAPNGFVGMADRNPASARESVLDIAREAGWSVGIVSDDSVAGGTPAPFLVEHDQRNESAVIAGKLIPELGRRADIVLGGGEMWFFDGGESLAADYRAGEREIVRENMAALDASPVSVFRDWGAFRSVSELGGLKAPVLGLFAPSTFTYYADGVRELRLVDLTRAALEFLRADDRPYFLMVEAALPDKASHANTAKRAIVEVLELDATLAYLRETVSENTLILVTTDHGTGGLALNGYLKSNLRGDILLRTNPGTGTSVLTFASGPGGNPDVNLRDGELLDAADPDFAQPALVTKDSAYHTGGDVWLLGSGPGSEAVAGYLDNTEIFELLRSAIQGDE